VRIGSTEVVATGLYTAYQTNCSVEIDSTDSRLKQQCCLTVSVFVSANSDVTFSLTELRFRNHT
jgi:hypothetical protein